VVTTTFDTCGLSRNVRVSVRTPFWFVVVISELSGPVVVVIAELLSTFALEFALLVASSVREQLPVKTARVPMTIIIPNFLNTASPSFPK